MHTMLSTINKSVLPGQSSDDAACATYGAAFIMRREYLSKNGSNITGGGSKEVGGVQTGLPGRVAQQYRYVVCGLVHDSAKTLSASVSTWVVFCTVLSTMYCACVCAVRIAGSVLG